MPRRIVAGQFGDAKFAGGQVGIGQSNLAAISKDSGQIAVAFGLEHGWIGQGAGRDDAHNFALLQRFMHHVVHLFADRHAIATPDQLLQIGINRVVGNARHWGFVVVAQPAHR